MANPWNAVLTLEGAVAWAGGIYRKQGVAYRSILCSPFTVRLSAVGYASAADKDEERARAGAEIWTPLWEGAARFEEIRGLLREGRAAVSGRAARNGLQFAEAAALLGVDRGISQFVRYSLLKRRGKSYIALPAGKFTLGYHSTADLIRELELLLSQANSAAKGKQKEAPASWLPLLRALKRAMFQALLQGGEDRLVDVASGFGAMHRWLLERKRELKWHRRLSSRWIEQCTKIKSEARIAAAVAGLWSEEKEGRPRNLRLGHPEYSWVGLDFSARMLATLRRRTLDGAQGEKSPFWSPMRASASDVIAFIEGRTDDELIENLIFAFALAKAAQMPEQKADGGSRRWPSYCVLKQFFSAETHPASGAQSIEPRFRPDQATAALLAGNRAKEATESAIRRLRIAGLTPLIRSGWDMEDAARLGAALLIPIRDTRRLRRAVAATPGLEDTRA